MEGYPSHRRQPLYKQQRICDLEGDTSVQEILNYHQLMYFPLYQVGLVVKMVQSLIQIWEEECLRIGIDMAIEKVDD